MKFVAIGHQDSWLKITDFVNNMRVEQDNPPLPLDRIKEVYGFIPPVKLFDVVMRSTQGKAVEGMYIESFISPDELDRTHLWQNIRKVQNACEQAARLGGNVVSLGGFASIVIETRYKNGLPAKGNTHYTTGNTLTAAFIADSIEKAATKWGRDLRKSTMLIIGATGDIGSACVNYFKDEVEYLLLVARQKGPLVSQEQQLLNEGISCRATTDVHNVLPVADVVICAASSELPANYLSLLPQDAIICDAGYPKNLSLAEARPEQKIFEGGMGLVQEGFEFTPTRYHKMIYTFPLEGVCHGCILESVVLAMENQPVALSAGKGHITKKAMKQILQMASKHGISTAPFFNARGLLNPTNHD